MPSLHSLQLCQQTCQVGPAAILLMRNSVGQKVAEVKAMVAFKSLAHLSL